MTDTDQKVKLGLNGSSDRIQASQQAKATSNAGDELVTQLVSLSFIWAAIRRGARVWCALAILGLIVGFGYKVARPPAYRAATSILLPQDEFDSGAILTDVAFAQSRTVAGLAVNKLGLRQSPASFAASYTVAFQTGEVLVITASSSSASAAIQRANAVASVFLAFRASLQQTEQRIAVNSYDAQINQAEQQIQSLEQQIRQLPPTATAANQTRLSALQTDLGEASTELSTANGNVRSTEQQTTLQIRDSKVLDTAAVIATPRKKPLILGAAIGLVAGLVVGLSIVVIRAVTSDRLRQRDDVSSALGAPIGLSVGKVHIGRQRLGEQELAESPNSDVRRIVAHLRQLLPPSPIAALAVVPIDDVKVAALAVASLAARCAEDGMRVVLADLLPESPAAGFFGTVEPGVHVVTVQRAKLNVVIPGASDLVPIGPLRSGQPADHDGPANELVEVCAAAHVLLTLVTADPSLGGADYVGTWASDAVVTLTAGRSSWTRIHAQGELLRLAEVRLVSAVLIGAEKSDESLGVIRPARASAARVEST